MNAKEKREKVLSLIQRTEPEFYELLKALKKDFKTITFRWRVK